ncbi:MAG: hypothetical protein ACE5FF_09045 [Saprospiraceae bacterium]
MKKILLQVIITAGLGYLAHLVLPFWAIAVAAFLAALLFQYRNSFSSFLAGFLAAFLLWGSYAFFLDSGNDSQLSGELGELFDVDGSYLIYFSALLGALLGGFGAMTGSLARKLVN